MCACGRDSVGAGKYTPLYEKGIKEHQNKLMETTFVLYWCPIFKWLSHMTWPKLQTSDILNHSQAFLVWLQDHHLNTGSVDNRTQIYHTGLVWYSDVYCTLTSLVWN